MEASAWQAISSMFKVAAGVLLWYLKTRFWDNRNKGKNAIEDQDVLEELKRRLNSLLLEVADAEQRLLDEKISSMKKDSIIQRLEDELDAEKSG